MPKSSPQLLKESTTSSLMSKELKKERNDVESKKENKLSLLPMKLVKNPSPITNIPSTLPHWFRLQNQTLDSNGNPLVLNIVDNYSTPGQQCILYPQTGSSNNELWQFSSDGHIVSRIDSNVVLDCGGFISGNEVYVVINNWSDYYMPTQNWTRNGNLITNQNFEGFNLGIQNAYQGPITPASGDNVVIANSDNQCFNWIATPTTPLNDVLTQQPVPFPSFDSGEQLAAYSYISQAVAYVPSIRDEYINLAAPLSSYQSNLENLQCPSVIPQSDFDYVKSQINNELTFAIAIINLFNNYNQFHLALFADNQARLDQMAGLCDLQVGSTTSVAGTMLSIFGGVIYTMLCAVPFEGINPFGIAANLIETAINVATAASQATSYVNPDPFQVEICNLWNQLSSNFEALLSTTGDIESTLLQDWGMMQSVYKLITTTTGPNSLSWTPEMTGSIIEASVPGYQIGLLQMLMPSKYQIYTFNSEEQNNNPPPSTIPDSCHWTESTGAGLFYFIADIEDFTIFPSDELMNTYIWGNGISRAEFFQSKFGWTFPTTINSYFDGGIYEKATLTFSNNSPDQMYFIINCKGTTYKYTVCTYQSDIGPALSDNFSVTVYNYESNQIASFDVNIDTHFLEGSDVSVSNQSVSDDYVLSIPLCNQGSFNNSYSASVNMSISLKNSN